MLEPREGPRPVPREASLKPPRIAVLSALGEESLLAALHARDWSVIACEDGAALLELVLTQRPDAVVVGLAGAAADVQLLSLLRRIAPRVPLILVAGDSDLALQRMLNELRPYYYDVLPFDAEALRDAVRSAVRPARGFQAGR